MNTGVHVHATVMDMDTVTKKSVKRGVDMNMVMTDLKILSDLENLNRWLIRSYNEFITTRENGT